MKPRDPEAFWHKVKDHFFDSARTDLDYQEFLDFAEECGLVAEEKYDPEKHGPVKDPGYEVEPGDPVYMSVPAFPKIERVEVLDARELSAPADYVKDATFESLDGAAEEGGEQ